ncbi:DUF362 domain-containing protein [Fonticella tunisiensis]|uniref:Uncharacterized protein DUF362 n=1 Tax=Fonticella tunisiensis TaxID=1096341 RepID=A0A4R7KSS7_9CLOT|nr:DUF362 domain-containing protein [Fonticella tunisiensis]TDT62762.1 uncharacterized protein DUF362 [Fonticella tunisiensis]
MELPKMIKIRQHFNREHIEDIEGTVKEQIKSSGIKIERGSRIAIAVGSRGVANIHRIVKATVEWIKEAGGEPFIVPAMGSHGGATADGQRAVLEGYGVTEEYTGAPIKSSMETVELPQGNLINKVYMDKYAYEADGTIIINRIKVHTDFHGPTESGLMKMCVIGLGKHKQALEIHRYGVYGLKELIPKTARQVLKHGNIILGIAVVENAYDETAIIRALRPSEIEVEEIKLLSYSRKNMPRIPFDKLDVLIVDEMGKNISGTGMDTNIINRIKIKNEPEPEGIKITNIVVSDLTEESHGNALGMGLADFITRKFADKIDFKATYENTITSTFIERAKMPIVGETDRDAIQYALRTCGPIDIKNARIVRIKNTLKLDEIYVSSSLLQEIQDKPGIDIVGEFVDILNEKGELTEF